jgi:hypothetical protein
MKICSSQLVSYLCIVPMTVYACCWYLSDCNFETYNICIATAKFGSFNDPFGLKRMFSSFLIN